MTNSRAIQKAVDSQDGTKPFTSPKINANHMKQRMNLRSRFISPPPPMMAAYPDPGRTDKGINPQLGLKFEVPPRPNHHFWLTNEL
jgi:hypothetical protein